MRTVTLEVDGNSPVGSRASEAYKRAFGTFVADPQPVSVTRRHVRPADVTVEEYVFEEEV